MSMFPTPEQELESKIREECFKEQFKLLGEISRDVEDRVKNLFYSLIQEGVSVKILYKIILNIDLVSWDGNIVKLVEELTKGFFKENKEERTPLHIKINKKEDTCDQ